MQNKTLIIELRQKLIWVLCKNTYWATTQEDGDKGR